jgi:NADPH-dependent glutamate synthase beta subunit-like oxidoreductase/glutamate synthase domain-containing protein 3/NAD-dependent dihydropyrimidine dehydrogenase PreA subunit
MNNKAYFQIAGKEEGFRIESRILEERVQDAVEKGERRIEIQAFGQQGLGGRLWKAGSESVHVVIKGQAGQRVGSLGFPNTFIEVMGPASDDVGWLNAGSQIVVHGNAGNGLANAMAQGKIFVAGNIGARGMTMTKSNPRFDPPEIWVLGSVGDYFGEFMAGGIAVICGVEPQDPENVLGYRPLVGMVGGKIYFRGPHSGYSDADAKQVPISDEDWNWFAESLKTYLDHINRKELFKTLSVREDWQLLVVRTPQEKGGVENRSMSAFKADVWDKELGRGGMIGDLTTMDRSPIPLIPTSELRRFVPVWENRKYTAPCEGTCPTGIPVHKRWRLVREGRIDEAVDLALEYTPFPATICGYLCPNPCMQACTRRISSMIPIDIKELGKASINAGTPDFPAQSGKKIAVIGGGPAGISVAWQLRKAGHEAVIYDTEETLGGKMVLVIPESRIPGDILSAELERISSVISHVHLKQKPGRQETERLKGDYDFLVIAAGAQKPRTLPIPGKERMIPSLDFLMKSKKDDIDPGKKIVIIGAGNVGCDVATEAGRLGAESITLIDVQEPASFGKEREDAESYGAVFKWPCFTREITEEGVVLQTGELLSADTVVISIGDLPDIDFLPKSVEIKDGFVKVDEFFRTSDPKIFAIGDVVKPGILSDVIGAGRKAAEAIITTLRGEKPSAESADMIDTDRIKMEYFDPRITGFDDIDQCGSQCSSCGNCRDCGICVAICPQAAISREDLGEGEYQYIVDDSRCIGCGFCAGACPCGIWDLIENEPMG